MLARVSSYLVSDVEKGKSRVSSCNVLCATTRNMLCLVVLGRDPVLAGLVGLVHFCSILSIWLQIGPLLAIMASDLTP